MCSNSSEDKKTYLKLQTEKYISPPHRSSDSYNPCSYFKIQHIAEGPQDVTVCLLNTFWYASIIMNLTFKSKLPNKDSRLEVLINHTYSNILFVFPLLSHSLAVWVTIKNEGKWSTRSFFVLKLKWGQKSKKKNAKILTSLKNKYKSKLSYHCVLRVIYIISFNSHTVLWGIIMSIL